MTRNLEESETLCLGDVIAAAFELGSAITPDGAMASELAARHLERVLVRGRNARIAAAMAKLARELEPAPTPRHSPPHRHRRSASVLKAA